MNSLFRKVDWKATLITSLVASILFCIPITVYITLASYNASWLLYLGSFLFFITVWIHTMRDSRHRGHNESTIALIFSSHVVTICGIVLSCIICFALLAFLVPGYLQPGMADRVMTNEPVNTVHDKTNGMSFQIFMTATMINFSVGSFTSIILP